MIASLMDMMRKLVMLLAVLALVALAWIGLGTRSVEEAPAADFDVAPIRRGELVATVSATGTLAPRESVQVGSQVSGTIHRLHVDYNSRVNKDELVAEIEPSLFEAALGQAQANLSSAKAAREKADIARQDARRQLDRLDKLSGSRVVSESELDEARFALAAAQAEERVQEAMLGQRRAALVQAEVNLAHTRIYAPIDGIVISRDVDVGQTVAASLQTPTLVVIAGDLKRMRIETQVDEAFIGSIEEGQPVRFSVFAYPERTFEGQLAQVRLNPSVEAGVVKYNCIIDVANPDLALKPGMTATVIIEVERLRDVLQVPNSALRFVPSPLPEGTREMSEKLGRREAILWAVDGGETLRPVVVSTGLVGDRLTEVTGEGVDESMEVAMPPRRGEKPRRRRRGIQFF